MSIEVKIPAVGESITSGVVSVWHKKSGDYVKAGDPLFTLETDKVSSEIVAEAAGVLSTKVDEGQEVKIGEIVAVIEDSAAAPRKNAEASAEATPDTSGTAKKESSTKRSPNADVLSPAVRRIVEEEQIDSQKVIGTGKGGRLTKADVVAYGDSDRKASAPEPSQASVTEAAESASQSNRVTRKKMSPIRRKIAAQLVMAQHTAAILTTFNECDMTEVQALRAKSQEAFTKKHGIKLGFMSFFIKATVEALQAVPSINGRIEGDDFIQNNYYDIGVAVGTERGLVVPVVRDADKKSFADLERDISEYATRAREGKIKIEDLQGGTFPISNGGVYGSLMGTPILNPPQSGILGMHAIQQRPVAIKGEVVVRPMMYLALSYDHRLVDGRESVSFLVRVKEYLEDPARLMLEI